MSSLLKPALGLITGAVMLLAVPSVSEARSANFTIPEVGLSGTAYWNENGMWVKASAIRVTLLKHPVVIKFAPETIARLESNGKGGYKLVKYKREAIFQTRFKTVLYLTPDQNGVKYSFRVEAGRTPLLPHAKYWPGPDHRKSYNGYVRWSR